MRRLILIASLCLGSCGPSADDAPALIRAGDTRACATQQAKDLLTQRLTTLVFFKKDGPIKDDKGQDISKLKLAYDPIVGTGGDAASHRVSCQAVAFFTLDGSKPYVANTVSVSFDLSTNLNNADEITISGNFRDQQEMMRIYFQNLGLSQSANLSVY